MKTCGCSVQDYCDLFDYKFSIIAGRGVFATDYAVGLSYIGRFVHAVECGRQSTGERAPRERYFGVCLIEPNARDAADFEVVAFVRCIGKGYITRTFAVLECVAIVGDTRDTTYIACGTRYIDIGNDIGNSDITFAHKADYTADVCTIFFAISLDITAGVGIHGKVCEVGISVLAEHTAYIGIAIDLNQARNADIGIFRCVRSTCNNAYIKVTFDGGVVDMEVFNLTIGSNAEETDVA